jgi:hypothetical protein
MKIGLFSLLLLVAGGAKVLAQSLGTITPTGSLGTPRQGHTATLLKNGHVLITGGFAMLAGWQVWATSELYSPQTGTFQSTGSLKTRRSGHTATLLPDGSVLIAGGDISIEPGVGNSTASAEVYDSDFGYVSETGAMISARSGHTATLLNDGRVLIAGGHNFNEKGEENFLASAELYDPLTGRFTSTGTMNAARSAPTATLLASGKVLISSYFNTSVPNEDALQQAELYDPASGTFSLTGRGAFPDVQLRVASSTLLINGDVLMKLADQDDPEDLTELYHPSTDTFDPGPKTSALRGYTTATVLPDGKVLLNGEDFSIHQFPCASAEIYDPATGMFSSTIPSGSVRGHTATLLLDGTVLLAGGWVCCGQTISSAEVYRPPVLTPGPVLFTVGVWAAVLHTTTHQLVSLPNNPATPGEALEIYLTGLTDGAVIPPQVSVEGHAAEVLYFGRTPGYDNLDQINIRLPNNLAGGAHSSNLRITYMGRPSNTVTIGVADR